MEVWLVNPFDPLPGDPEQEGRYATLARLLAGRGHRVVWWTSVFSHRFKRKLDTERLAGVCRSLGIDVEFLYAPGYRRNVSLRRLWNHYLLARIFEHKALHCLRCPSVIVASSPPPGLAASAGRVARRRGAAFLVDVQDLWPENFYRLVPDLTRPLAGLLLRPMEHSARWAYRAADTIMGVADEYVRHASGAAGGFPRTMMIPLGVDVTSLEAARLDRHVAAHRKSPGEVWLVYSGSFTRNYDWLTVLEAAARLSLPIRTRIRLFLTGAGDLLNRLRKHCERLRLNNVTIAGFLDFPTWVHLLDQSDVGFNACLPEARIFLPNKVFYYLALGLAVINSIPGQCSEMLRRAGCGVDYEAGNPASCAEAIEHVVANPERMESMKAAARRLGRTFDRRILYQSYVQEIEHLGSTRGPRRPAQAE